MDEKAHILIVDDEQQMLAAMEAVLARMGHAVFKCSHGKDALEVLERSKVDLIISDMRMPVMNGEELLAAVRELHPRIPLVMITAYGTISQAVGAMRQGALDFITKPFAAEDLERVVQRAIEPPKRASASAPVREVKKASAADLTIVTKDRAFKQVLEIAIAIAPSSASVLLQGESGTGKELVARLIHSSSDRAQGPFVAVNCAALPETLLESELFGHEKGAFTGAIAAKCGKFELANGGTLLLDEISEMDFSLQAKLLRVLQEREVDRVGSSKPIPVDTRVIATSNRDMREVVMKGLFRDDLYYRLSVIPLYIPPLCARADDIRLLTEHFVRIYSDGAPKRVSAEVIEQLERHSWPGNVRELQNACQRAVLLSTGDALQTEHFFLGALAGRKEAHGEQDLKLRSGLSVAEAERRLINETLRATGNNKTRAAELLGISIRTLRNKLNEYGEEDSRCDGGG